MQPGSNKELQAMSSMIALEDLHNGANHDPPPIPYPTGAGAAAHDDFFDHMLSTYPSGSWPPPDVAAKHGLFNTLPFDDPAYDESTAILASRLRLHQISGGAPAASKLLAQQMLAAAGADSGLAPLPLTLSGSDSAADVDGSFHPHNNLGGDIHGGGYTGFNGSSLPPPPQMVNNQNGSNGSPTFNAPANQPPAAGGVAAGNNGGAPRQRVRARRGQATDPHSIAERLRRERIAERMKALQELVPNANKTDKASMLDEIIDYVKFLQLQVKVLSMSRLGGAAAVAPLVADNSSEREGGLGRGTGNGKHPTPGTDSLTVTEQQVAKLMEEDMGSAMQYLQGKGLCLMPISLASAISSVTRSPNPLLGTGNSGAGADAPPSPSISVLTVQSAIANNVGAESSAKDGASVSKP